MQFNSLPPVSFSVNDAGKVLFVIRQEEAISPFYGLRSALLIIHEQEGGIRQGTQSLEAIKNRLATLAKRPKWFLRLTRKTQEIYHLEDAVKGLEISLRDAQMQLNVAQKEADRIQDKYPQLKSDYDTLQLEATTDALAHKLARALAVSIWSMEHGLPETAGMAFFDAIEGLPEEKHGVFYEALNQKLNNAKLAGMEERRHAIASASNSFTKILQGLPPEERARVLAEVAKASAPMIQPANTWDFSNIQLAPSGENHVNF